MELNIEDIIIHLKKIYSGPKIKIEPYILSENNKTLIESLKGTVYEEHFTSLSKFKSYIQEVLKKKIIIGYCNILNSKDNDTKINIKELTDHKVEKIYNYFKETDKIKKIILLQEFNNCNLYPKYKKGDTKDVKNYRFLSSHTIELKIIDKIISDIILTLAIDVFDRGIFKAQLKENFCEACIDVAIENTLSIKNVVLLDISKAFDSVKWKILYENIISILSTILNLDLAIAIVNEYFIFLENRKIFYRKHKKSKKHYIDVIIGIPQGLPSSNIIFSLFICSILNKWKDKINLDYKKYLKIIIFVDDFYLKFYETFEPLNILIIETLINELNIHYLFVNKEKTLADERLNMDFSKLTSSDSYLGIPFTREIIEYRNWILSDYINKKIDFVLTSEIILILDKDDNLESLLDWNKIYKIISNKNNLKIYKSLTGFLNYKLKPLIKYTLNIKTINKDIIIKFIKEYFL